MKRILLLGLLLITGVLAACGSSTPEPVELTIDLSEFAYSPETIELVVGQEVTFNFTNSGALDHEFMIGRDATIHDGVAEGYSEDFFAVGGIEPVVVSGMAMLNGEEVGMADDDHDEMEMEMDMGDGDHDTGGHDGFMVMLTSDMSTATITFTVTSDMVGTWEFGCFLDQGTHYAAGMTGTLIVTEK